MSATRLEAPQASIPIRHDRLAWLFNLGLATFVALSVAVLPKLAQQAAPRLRDTFRVARDCNR